MVPPIRRRPPINWALASTNAAPPSSTSTQTTSTSNTSTSTTNNKGRHETQDARSDSDNSDMDTDGDCATDADYTPDEDSDSDEDGDSAVDIDGNEDLIPDAVDGNITDDPSTALSIDEVDVVKILIGLPYTTGFEAVKCMPGPGHMHVHVPVHEPVMDTRPDYGPNPASSLRSASDHHPDPAERARNEERERLQQRDPRACRDTMIPQVAPNRSARQGDIPQKSNGNTNDGASRTNVEPHGRRNRFERVCSSAQGQSPRNRARHQPYSAPASAAAAAAAAAPPSNSAYGSTSASCSAFAHSPASASTGQRGRLIAIRIRRPEQDPEPAFERSGIEEEDGDEEEATQPPPRGSLVSCTRSVSPGRRLTAEEERIINRHASEERQLTKNRRSPSSHSASSSQALRTEQTTLLTTSPHTSTSSQTSHTEPTTPTTPSTERCNFQGCRAHLSGQDMHLRKIVSHIFGRNKNTTKRIPGEIWEVYCRKHYQRTRYRSGADEDKDGVNNRGKTWAGEQCNFVVDALRRMGRLSRTLRLSGFRVSLRKRELERIEGGIRLVVRPKPTAPASGSGGGTASGSGAGAGAGTSQPSSGPCSSSTSADTTPASNSSTKPKKKAKQKRPAVPAPVPEWLILYVTQHEDQVLSFDKVTNLVRRIQAHIETVVLGPNQEVRFPDIEFLPVFGDADSLSLTSSSGTGGSGAPGSDQGSGESAGSDRGRGRRPHSGAFSGFTKTRKSS